MSRPKNKYKKPREEKTTDETLILAAVNSQYNTCTPMMDAEYIRIKHPISRTDIHCSTKSNVFFETFKELHDKGMGDKLFSELTSFGSQIDEKWFDVLEKAKDYCAKNN